MLLRWLTVAVLSIAWVWLAVGTVELALDCYWSIKAEHRNREEDT